MFIKIQNILIPQHQKPPLWLSSNYTHDLLQHDCFHTWPEITCGFRKLGCQTLVKSANQHCRFHSLVRIRKQKPKKFKKRSEFRLKHSLNWSIDVSWTLKNNAYSLLFSVKQWGLLQAHRMFWEWDTHLIIVWTWSAYTLMPRDTFII